MLDGCMEWNGGMENVMEGSLYTVTSNCVASAAQSRLSYRSKEADSEVMISDKKYAGKTGIANTASLYIHIYSLMMRL